ncbi:MAG: AMP-binding protein, partial [Egibacteraceae bacterium]
MGAGTVASGGPLGRVDIATLDGLLRAAADRWPDRLAVDSPSGRLTYAELDAAVTAAAGGLRTAGARPGDHVAFALGHDAALYAAPFVCSRARLAGLLLSTALPAAAWARQLASVRPSLLVADDAHVGRLQAAASGAPVQPARVALPLQADHARPAEAAPAPDPDRAVALLATSGTTGQPTVVRLTSRGLLHVGRAYLDLLDLGPDERSLVVMPLTHIGALSTQTLTMPMVGGCNVLPADRRARRSLSAMAEQRITLLDAAPAWLTVLAGQTPIAVPSWRTLVYGGAPMPAATVSAVAAAHPAVAMFDVWGLSEAHGPVTAQRYDRDRPPPAGTVGG